MPHRGYPSSCAPRAPTDRFCTVNEVSTEILYTFAAYMSAVMIISFIAWRRNKNLKDYILAGRGLGSFVTAISAQASDMSAWLLLALPGAAYAFGLGYGWMALGLAVGTYLNWLIVARRLREDTQRYDDSLTLPDYFHHRFGDRTHLLRGLTAIFILLFFTFYVASGFVAGARLFESLFHVTYFWALVFGAATVMSYTFIGGFLAVAWNDVLQGGIMFFALVIVALLGVAYVGGFGGLRDTMNAVNGGLLHPLYNVSAGHAFTWIGIASLLAWGLGYPGQPHILARFMALKDPNQMGVARRIAMGWVIVVLGAAILVGVTGLGVVTQHLAGDAREKVFIYMSLALLPPVAAGVALSGILAAIMSTASAQLLVAASAFAEDIYRGFFRAHAGQSELLWVGRIALLAIAVLAFVAGLNPKSMILGLVAYAWAGFGAAFGPTIILALYWKRMNWFGAMAGIVIGGATVVIWHALSQIATGGPTIIDLAAVMTPGATAWVKAHAIFRLYEMLPGVVFSTVAIVLASLFTPRPVHARGPRSTARSRTGRPTHGGRSRKAAAADG